MAVVHALTCTRATSRRQAKPTSASSLWRPGARRPTSPMPNAPRWRLLRPAPGSATGPNPVPDEIWDEAARNYDEPALAVLVINIALINAWNRINVSRQVAGARANSGEAETQVESGSGSR
jgi:alkylhydroperoxidase family enzyme